ncbi:hypothetical protein NXH76_18830 [Blautia schinkii]|nr:hypothetical protein [Blautia schinkii]
MCEDGWDVRETAAGQIVKDHTIRGWTMDVKWLKKVICLRTT